MLFQQFCFSVVGEYEQGQAHLCVRATTFYALPVPLPRQVYNLAAQGQHLAAQGQHLAAQGQHLGAQGQHLAAQGQHLAAQGQHLAKYAKIRMF